MLAEFSVFLLVNVGSRSLIPSSGIVETQLEELRNAKDL